MSRSSREKTKVEKAVSLKTDNMTFEEALSFIEDVISEFDSGESSLEDSLVKYRQAMQVLDHAENLLKKVRNEMKLVDESGERVVSRKEFLRHDPLGD